MKTFRKGIALTLPSWQQACSPLFLRVLQRSGARLLFASASFPPKAALFSEPVTFSMLIPSHASWLFQDDWYVIDLAKNIPMSILTSPAWTPKVFLKS
ncbi:MAG: hypothetical protein ACLR7U_07405 [Ruthenibacterium lactatiformans]